MSKSCESRHDVKDFVSPHKPSDEKKYMSESNEAWYDDTCAVCGYLLNGLPVSHRCPECGTDYDFTSCSLNRCFGKREKRILWGVSAAAGIPMLIFFILGYWISALACIWLPIIFIFVMAPPTKYRSISLNEEGLVFVSRRGRRFVEPWSRIHDVRLSDCYLILEFKGPKYRETASLPWPRYGGIDSVRRFVRVANRIIADHKKANGVDAAAESSY